MLRVKRCARRGALRESGTAVRRGSVGSLAAIVVTTVWSLPGSAGLWLAEGTGDEGVIGTRALHFVADMVESATFRYK